MDIRYSEKAEKQLKRVCKGDRKSAAMLMAAIEAYAADPDGNFDVKVLKGSYGEFKRLRVGRYRVIFDEQGSIMLVYEIKHRQGAYND